MATFLVCSLTDRPDLEEKITQAFPDEVYVLRADSQWLVEADETTQKVGEKLEIEGGKYGSVVVFPVANWWGWHRAAVWEWLDLE